MKTITEKKTRLLFIGSVFVTALVAVALIAAAPARAGKDDDDDDDNKGGGDKGFGALMEGKHDFKLNEFPQSFLRNRATSGPSTVTVNPNGKILLGSTEVTESNWPNLKVKSWGIVYNVHVMPDAKLIGFGTTSTTTASSTPMVSVGDRLDVLGEIEMATGLVHARQVRNRSTANKQADDLQSRIRQLLEEIERVRAQLKDLRKGSGGALGRWGR